MRGFQFITAGQIRFGRGEAELAAQNIADIGQRVLLVRGGSVPWVAHLIADLKSRGCSIAEFQCRNEPDLTLLDEAAALACESVADVVVSVGGGSVLDLGKAVAAMAVNKGGALRYLEGVGDGRSLDVPPLPFVAIPTTSGTGAEVTKNAVILVPEAGRKVSLRDNRMLPDLAIVDPVLTDNAPRSITLASGFDAITQVIEPYLCNRANPMTDALCQKAIPLGMQALARLEKAEDPSARDDMAFVSLCGGLALANSGLGAVHGLAGVVGGRLGAPHGLICGRLLGPVLSANYEAMVSADCDVSRFCEVKDWLETCFGLPRRGTFSALGELLDEWAVARLGEWLTVETDFEAIASEASGASSMRANPCVLPKATLVDIMRQAA